MANYATNSDLTTLLPSIFNHGETDFTDELTEATADVKRDIEVEWLKRGFRKGDGNTRFDATLLTDAQWKRATMYKALADYIMPRLSPFRDEDSFQLQMKHYKTRYAEEMAAEFGRGIQYDTDNDSAITDDEYFEAHQDRLYR